MHIEKKTLRNVFLGVAACIVLYWLLNETAKVKLVFSYIADIFAPFLTGAAIAFILNVPMRSIERGMKKIKSDKLRRLLSLLVTFICVLLVLALVFILLIPQVISTVETLLPQLKNFVMNSGTAIYNYLESDPELMKWAKDSGLLSLDWAAFVEKVITFLGSSVSTILGGTFSAINVVTSFVVDLIIALVFAIYCLFQKETLIRQGKKLLFAIVPEKFADEVIRIMRLSNITFSNFLSGQCLEVLILGGMFAVSMAILGMPYIPLVSLLVAVTAFIPIVGAFAGCIIGTFLILVSNPVQALIFVAMFLVLQQIEGNMIYPRVVGTSIGLSGMWVLLAVAVGGTVFGVAGMFLMIPVASVLFTLLKEFANRRLAVRNIAPDKLAPQPLEFRSSFSERISQHKSIRVKEKKDETPKA